QVPDIALPGDDVAAFNLGSADTVALLQAWNEWLGAQAPAQQRRWRERVQAQRLEQRGIAGFFDAHPGLRVPMVLAPATAHYSWSKGMKLLGLGRDLLRAIPQRGMRLDADALADMVEACRQSGQPVLMTVGVL